VTIKKIELNSNARRIVLAAAAILTIAAAVLIVRWSFGSTISANASDIEIADFAVDLAPGDPQTHYAAAVLRERTFEPDDAQAAVGELEKAAALSPNNYLLWLALAKALEASGDRNGAEAALRRAKDLAPNYSGVR